MPAEPNRDWLIPVDDHILEPPDHWADRVPAYPFTAADPAALTRG